MVIYRVLTSIYFEAHMPVKCNVTNGIILYTSYKFSLINVGLFTINLLMKITHLIVHYDTSAMKRYLTSVRVPKASDVITLVKKTFFARVSYEILYHEL